jgi:hypothetical protein
LLVLGLPPDYPARRLAVLEGLLTLAAASLGQALQLESARREHEEASDLVTAGEAAIGMVHAIVNHLNSMMLQAMALQIRLPEPLKNDLEGIRREGRQAAARLQQLQHIREQTVEVAGCTDLEEALRLALQRSPGADQRFQPTFAGNLPLVRVPRWTAQRLLQLLVHIFQTCHQGSRPAPIHTGQRSEGVFLSAEIDGPTLEREGSTSPDSRRLIDLQGVNGGIGGLERTAAHYLARRLGGQLAVQNRPGGVLLTLTWPRSVLAG